MSKFLYLLTTLLMLLVAQPATALLDPVEEAVETQRLIVQVSRSGKGRVAGRQCDDCAVQSFVVSPELKIRAEGRPVGIAELRAHNGLPATIIYDLESRLATKIIW